MNEDLPIEDLPIDDALREQLARMRQLEPTSRAISLAITKLEECLHWLDEAAKH